ncbi:MAG: penicillin acylase family protein [Rhodospirillales bacterium]
MKGRHRLIKASIATFLFALLGASVPPFLSLPPVDGHIGLGAGSPEATVRRDEHGVPSIEAASLRDAYFALGFVHAQDRLWQMEGMRRLGAGRLSEVVGSATLSVDRTMRTLGLYRLAEGDAAALPPARRAEIDSYAAGINAWLGDPRNVYPPEFALLGFRPEPWKPADTLVWARIMAMRLSGNWLEELLRLGLSGELTIRQIAELWPDGGAVPQATGQPVAAAGSASIRAILHAISAAVPPTTASNAWAIGGGLTESGAPILASDPHLGFSAPVLWYLARIETPEAVLAGASVPGVPAILLGRNRRLAWGMTTTHSDTQDLFVERTDPANPDRYATPDGWRDMAVRIEEIRVRDGETEQLRVRVTRHGPVVSDLDGIGDDKLTLALRSTALEPADGIAGAVLELALAGSVDAAIEALRAAGAPQQNVVLADRDGAIAMISPARVPMRKAGDGRAPVDGESGVFDWAGFVPFDELPLARGEPGGWIGNANNRPVSPDYPHLLAADWPSADRMQRLAGQLSTATPKTPAANAALQMDVVSVMAAQLLPRMLALTDADAGNGAVRAALDMLKGWDRAMKADRPEPLVFAFWLRNFARALYADETGALYSSFGEPRPDFLRFALTPEGAGWCDDITTAEKSESCGEILTTSLADTIAMLGGDPSERTWGERHHAVFSHTIFRHVPVLGGLTTINGPTSGGAGTLNRGGYGRNQTGDNFPHVHGAGYRAVYELSPLESADVIIATGQSGNPVSGRYRDLFGNWLEDRRLHYSTLPGSFDASPHQVLTIGPDHD